MLSHDQAEGLRRILAPVGPRVIAFFGAASGAGRTSAVLNLATALAHSGRAVMVLDGHPAGEGLWGTLGLRVRHGNEHSIVRGPAGIALAAAPGRPGRAASAREPALLGNGAPDTVLLHPPQAGDRGPWSSVLADADVVVVMTGRSSSMTAAYAAVKRLSTASGVRHFRVLVNRAESEAQAMTLVRNMARVAREFLAVSLDLLGWVPWDAKLGQAAGLRLPVVEAFPRAPAARAYRTMAERIAAWPIDEDRDADLSRLMGRLLGAPRVAAATA